MLNLSILFLGVSVVAQVQAPGCSLNLSTTSFVVVDQDFKLPDNSDTVSFKLNEDLYVGCPPTATNNLLLEGGEKATCLVATLVKMARTGNILDLNDVKCKDKLPSSVRKLDSVCGEKGTLVEVGFDIYQNFSPSYSICFDEINLVPLYVFFETLEKVKLLDESASIKNRFVDTGHLYGDIDIDRLYLNQKKIFEELGVSQYIDDTTYLIPAQLLPSHLFPYGLKANASFDYANVVPKWNSLENRFEEFMDYYPWNLNPFFYVGTTGVATLRNDVGVEVELYLYDGKVPVPRWLWWKDVQGQGNVTIWGYNNPYFNSTEVLEEFTAMCQTLGIILIESWDLRDFWMGISRDYLK